MTSTERSSELSSSEKRALLLQLLERKDASSHPIYPLSHGQQALWFLERVAPDSAVYNEPLVLRLHGELDMPSLRRALRELGVRHSMLRTVYSMLGDAPVQKVLDAEQMPIEELDGSGWSVEQVESHLQAESYRPIDLALGPVARIQILRRSGCEHLLLFILHHIAVDAWSFMVLFDELGQLYDALRSGQPNPLPPPRADYRDYVRWQRGMLDTDRGERLWAYWRTELADPPPLLDLPSDRPFPRVATRAGALHPFALDADLSAALEALARREGVTLYVVLLAAFQLLLHRITGQDDLMLSSPVNGRTQPAFDGVVGYFVNPVLLRARFNEDLTFSSLLQQTSRSVLDALEHQDYPFALLASRLSLARDVNRPPLANVAFVMQQIHRLELHATDASGASAGIYASGARLTCRGLSTELMQVEPQRTKFDLELEIVQLDDTYAASFQYSSELFDRDSIARMSGQLLTLLRGIVADPSRRVHALPLLADEELARLVAWNATTVQFPGSDSCLHEHVERQTARTPDAVAVSFEARELTYRELDRKANQLAHRLRALGVGPDMLVGVYMDRSIELVVALLGILKAGAAYVPFDPSYPPERLAFMFEDAGATAVVTQPGLASLVPAGAARLVPLDPELSVLQRWPVGRVESGVTPRDLAYMIYTSGSSGLPKGALNEHAGICNRLEWMQQSYRLGPEDRVLQKTPYSFDVSVWEFFWPLLSGARLVIAQPGGHHDPHYLVDTIRNERVTTVHFVPAMLRAFLDTERMSECRSLRRVVCSGEALPPDLVERCLSQLPDTALYNLYGPTEAAVDVTAFKCDRAASRDRIPIGRPIANTQIWLLDAHGQHVPINVPGELYIGGVNVGRGYHRRPQLTEERFSSDPFSADPRARLYRTGDLAVRRANGELEFLGRNDLQVKIRGFRIELGEIEAQLGQHPGVRDAIVVAREDPAIGTQLVAYYTRAAAPDAPDHGEVDAESLHVHLGARLPEYMLPSAYVGLEQLPLTPSGKVDRAALAARETSSRVAQGYEAPVGEVESWLAKTWAELLGLEQVGRHANFFALGGHSLLAVSLAERMRKADMRADVRALLSSPTLAALAASVESAAREPELPENRIPPGARRITPEMVDLVRVSQTQLDLVVELVEGNAHNVQDIYPLAPLQEGMLFHHLAQTEGDVYLTRLWLAFESKTRLEDFVSALRQVTDRHDILRTGFVWEGLDEPLQVVWRKTKVELEFISPGEGVGGVERLRQRCVPSETRLDLRRPPLFRCFAAEDVAERRWVLCWLVHHLVDDNTTLKLILDEVRAIERGELARLQRPVPFRNFVARARSGARQAEHEAFFSEMLRDIHAPTAPFGMLDVNGSGGRLVEARRTLPPELSSALRSDARELGVSPASVLHLAWALVLARTSACERVVFGTVLSGRMQAGADADRALGMFINTLPLRIDVDARGVADALRATHVSLVELVHHEHAPLVLAQRQSSVVGRTPLFTSLLNYRFNRDARALSDVLGSGVSLLGADESTNYPLSLVVDDLGKDFVLTAYAASMLDPELICDYVQTALSKVLEALRVDPDRDLSELDVLPDAERQRSLYGWNDGAGHAIEAAHVADLFEARTRLHPERCALACRDERLTFEELNVRANQVAHWLRAHGVVAGSLVAIAMERSVATLVGLLGVLKAGGAYVPLDPGLPSARLAALLADIDPVCVLAEQSLALPATVARRIDLDSQRASLAAQPRTNPTRPEQTARDLAYVIFTSGSTGTPKGVEVEHRSVVHLWAALEREIFERHPGCQNVSLNAALTFDASVQQWVQWLSGRTLVVVPEAVRSAPAELWAFLARERVDAFDCTPAQLGPMLDEDADVPRKPMLALVGGEAIGSSLWQALAADREVAYYNVYGPTECTVDTTATRIVGETPQIGRPLANARAYVLDTQARPAGVHVAGELYISGAGVARGYHRLPELTAERFTPDPFVPGARMYRTGDRARWREDGTLEYLGRDDEQIKLRGYRIELGEIEAQLAELSAVQQVAVVLRQDDSGEQRLLAYYVAREALSAETLRAEATQRLPGYMVPAAYVRLERLPLTPSGKLDKTSLPDPSDEAFSRGAYEPPQGSWELGVAEIWSELLAAPRVGRDDDFFELGGHSLLAVQLVSRVRRAFDVDVALSEVFEQPTLSRFATCVQQARRSHELPILRAARGGLQPLSLAQRRLWFLAQLEGASEAYHIRTALRLHGVLDLAVLQRAFDALVSRHEALRTRYVLHDGEPKQEVAASAIFPFSEQDVSADRHALDAARRRCEEHARQPFDLSREFAVRALLLRVSDQEHVLQLVMHHIAADGWSLGIVLNELGVFYRAYLAGTEPLLAELPLQYVDYAGHQQRSLAEDRFAAQSAYWRDQLTGAPSSLALPSDRVRPAEQDYAGDMVWVSLDRALSLELEALSQRHGVTMYMTLLASWAALLSRLSGQLCVVVGTPVAGRDRAELEDLVGCFVNTLALRLDLGGDPTVAELLARTKEVALSAQLHRELPFDQVVEVIKPPRSLAHPPVFQVMLDWHNAPTGSLEMPGLSVEPLELPLSTAQFDLTLALRATDTGVEGCLNYATSLFDRSTAERYVGYWRKLLAEMVSNDQQRCARIGLMPESEQSLVLEKWNATERHLDIERGVAQRIADSAALRPLAVAVMDRAGQLTYAELNTRANQLGRYLRRRGVAAESRVGVCAQRGSSLLVALLGIWKAGGVYVPLDPMNPQAVLAYMLEDSAPLVLLTAGHTARVALSALDPSIPVLDVEQDAAAWIDESTDNPEWPVAPSSLAYVIYTSGSTGQPKGVMVEQGSLTNYVVDAQRWFALSPRDVVLQQNALNFDLSLEECLPALAAGATLQMAESPFGTGARIESGPSVVHLTAAHFQSLVGSWSQRGGAVPELLGVRLLNVTGDALSTQKLAQWEALTVADTELINTYGPTECTVSCSASFVRYERGTCHVSIGRPFANTELYVLDELRAPVPVGVVGELYVGGVQVARGYQNRPEWTAERFLPSPFREHGRVYRTGDLARWRADGALEFVGRADTQVKLRGFRVELGEVEAKLSELGGVLEVVAVVRGEQPDDKRLIAYYAAEGVDVEALERHAAEKLPAYMRPAAYVQLETLPRTLNGKLDRRALPEPAAESSPHYVPPEGSLEQALARLWAEVLKLPRVGRHDDFFQLGGHSLLAIRLLERLRQEKLHVDVRTLFSVPTVAGLAARLDVGAEAVPVPPNLIGAAPSAGTRSTDAEEFRL